MADRQRVIFRITSKTEKIEDKMIKFYNLLYDHNSKTYIVYPGLVKKELEQLLKELCLTLEVPEIE